MDEESERKFALLKYYHRASGKEPIHRLEPCLTATIDKLETIRQCCESVAVSYSIHSSEGEALMGCASILYDTKGELYDAIDVLHESMLAQ